MKFFFSKHGNRALIVLKMILAFIAGGYLFWGKRDVVQIKLPPPESSLRLKPTVKPAPIVSEEGRKKAVGDVKQASAIQKSIQPDPQPAASSSQATPSSMPVPNKQAAKEFAGKIMDEFDDNLSKTPIGPELRSLIDGYSAIFADAYEKGQILHKHLEQFQSSLESKITRFVYEKYKEELVQKLSGLENPTVDDFVNVLMELRDKIDSLAAHQLGIDPERVFNGLKRLIRKNAPLQEQLAQAIFKYSFAQSHFESSAYILVEFFTQNEVVEDLRKLETSILDSAAAEKARIADEKKKEQMAKAREIREQADIAEPAQMKLGNAELQDVLGRPHLIHPRASALLKLMPLDKAPNIENRLINIRNRGREIDLFAKELGLETNDLLNRINSVTAHYVSIQSEEYIKSKICGELKPLLQKKLELEGEINGLRDQLNKYTVINDLAVLDKLEGQLQRIEGEIRRLQKIQNNKNQTVNEHKLKQDLDSLERRKEAVLIKIEELRKKLSEISVKKEEDEFIIKTKEFRFLNDQLKNLEKEIGARNGKIEELEQNVAARRLELQKVPGIEDELDSLLETVKGKIRLNKTRVVEAVLAKNRNEQQDRERNVQEQLKRLGDDSPYSFKYKYPTLEEYLAAPPEFFLTLGTRTAEEILAARLGRENLQFSEPEQKRVAMTPAHDLDKFIVDNKLENPFLELNQDAVEAGFEGRSAGAILTLTKEKVPPKTFIIQATVQGQKIVYEISDKFGVPKARGDKEQLFEFLYREVQALNPDGAGVSMELRTSTSQ
ncbi:MAG: hypothetical protein JSS32_09155 [Verrucomicrobia bacterium]|nr:hypothetical protein [Verrucomicrobiota bacterium]